MRSGGWFTLLFTDIDFVTLTNFHIHAARDGIDLVSCRHVFVKNITVEGGGDDALALKNDFSKYKKISNYFQKNDF